jgi:hypothetical protein
MIKAGVPIPIVAQSVGWSSSTIVSMTARYGHYSMDALRIAVGTISAGSMVKSLVSNESKERTKLVTH